VADAVQVSVAVPLGVKVTVDVLETVALGGNAVSVGVEVTVELGTLV